MKWVYRIQNRTRMALMFLVVVLVLLGCSFLEKIFITDLSHSVSSIYKDRLIPATELFHINDLMHERRLLLVKLEHQPANRDAIGQQLAHHHSRIDSILHEYEKTFLVAEESQILVDF